VTEDLVQQIADGYAIEGAALELGALVLDGTAHPQARIRMPLSMLNRHGLVAGATGTGKTKTMQLMAEQLSAAGVPVFLADIKGDVSGMAAPGEDSDRVRQRATDTGSEWTPEGFPVEFLTLGGLGKGAACRATVTSFGPILLAKVLNLNRTQESSLGLIFHYADTNGLALLDLKDLRAVIGHLTSDEGKADLRSLGGISSATAGVILRELTTLENQGGDVFFGEPEFEPADLLRTADDGRGILSIMSLAEVQDRPRLFSTFLIWLLAELFQDLPEVGDLDAPKLVFFFEEAHLLFADASDAFLDAITQTVRLIRSKGVGVFFLTQTPKDVPADVLAQLSNRVQHALRAFTPDDAKALKATVSTFPRSTAYQLDELLVSMGIGEAAVTIMSERGAPTPVAWTRMRPPRSLMDPVDPQRRDEIIGASAVAARYSEAIDRDSAYERLLAKVATQPAEQPAEPVRAPAPERAPAPRPAKREEGLLDNPAVRSFARAAATAAGREIMRSLFGTARRRR
jgi:uncharacterized protein